MLQVEKHEALNRLAYIEGHLQGIRKMVEEEQHCVDVLKQTHAVKRALDKFDALLFQGHVARSVPEGFREGRDVLIIRELSELFALSRR